MGKEICSLLAQLGHKVLATARSSNALKELWDNEESVSWIALDLADPDSPSKLVDEAIKLYGQIDGVVNNAGTIEPIEPLSTADPVLWAQAITVNLTAPALLMAKAVEHLKKTSGKVVNISTGASVKVMQGWSAYCASKAGFLHLTSVAAAENPEIAFFSLRPGVVDTKMQDEIRSSTGMAPEDHQKFQNLKETGGLEPPEVPARAAVWLLLHGPLERSGEFLQYTDEQISQGVETLFQVETLGS
jgi:NAD(P)-dependent dehydrogenase (short-subunit alcohol dehydrogenase family)